MGFSRVYAGIVLYVRMGGWAGLGGRSTFSKFCGERSTFSKKTGGNDPHVPNFVANDPHFHFENVDRPGLSKML